MALAQTLYRLTAQAGSPPAGLRSGFTAAHRGLYPRPHHRRYDFDATARGAAWIDERAAEALPIVQAADGPLVVGHCDWGSKHVHFDGGKVVAVYDWDSLAAEPEAVVAGLAAAQFTAVWDVPGIRIWPSPEEREAFILDYESARGRPFTGAQRRVVDAAIVYLLAYSSRTEHSVNAGSWPEDSSRRRLAELPPLG
jgi:aminoglycoside phosphotransferase (APT) family kinase protein